MKKIIVFSSAVIMFGMLPMPSASAAVVNCKGDFSCMIKAAATCKPAQATVISKSTLGPITATSKESFAIKGSVKGKCDFRSKMIDLQYLSEDASSSAEIAQMNESAKSARKGETRCTIPKKELVKRLTDSKKGIFHAIYPDPYCNIVGGPGITVTAYIQPGSESKTTIGSKTVVIKYVNATDTGATLVVTVGGISKTMDLSLNKKETISGVDITVTSIKQSDVFTKGKDIGVQIGGN